MSQSSDSSHPHRPCPRVVAYPPKPRRHRPVNPHAAANALALQHRDIAITVAGNISRRTGHPKEDLEQIAMLGIIQAARRYSPERGSFRPYAHTYANGEVYHYLRDKGFLIKVPASWRDILCSGTKTDATWSRRPSIAKIIRHYSGSLGRNCHSLWTSGGSPRLCPGIIWTEYMNLPWKSPKIVDY
jgi:hypothetical protein